LSHSCGPVCSCQLLSISSGAIMNRQKTIFARLGWVFLVVCFQFCDATVEAQQGPDPRIADLVSTGKLRVGIGLANLVSGVKDPATGELRGVAVDLGRALAARIKVEFQPIEYPRPGVVLEGAKNNAWDVTFLVIDPARAADADFSAPYMESDFTLLVPGGSPIRNFADADQPGIHIGVPRGDAVDLRLTRIVKKAELVRVDNQAAGADLLRTGQTHAYAAPRPALIEMSAQLSGTQVLDDSFATISFAAFVPKGRDEHLAYVSEFLEEAKAFPTDQDIYRAW
jgi:polar amino acid transport system substrate-binding protein